MINLSRPWAEKHLKPWLNYRLTQRSGSWLTSYSLTRGVHNHFKCTNTHKYMLEILVWLLENVSGTLLPYLQRCAGFCALPFFHFFYTKCHTMGENVSVEWLSERTASKAPLQRNVQLCVLMWSARCICHRNACGAVVECDANCAGGCGKSGEAKCDEECKEGYELNADHVCEGECMTA